jgi:two-component system, cell cycle response regulator
MLDGKKREISVCLRHKPGHLVPVHVWCVPIRDKRGNVIGASESFEERKPSAGFEVRFHELATHGCLDTVTGLPSEAFTRTRLREQLGRFCEHRLPFSILIISLAPNKVFTAARGHPAAERMLQSAAQTLSNVSRPTDFLGRWEGDQLLAILIGNHGVAGRMQPLGKLVGLSQIHWWGDSVAVSVVLAGAEPEIGDTLESLLSRAEAQLNTGTDGVRSSGDPAQPED